MGFGHHGLGGCGCCNACESGFEDSYTDDFEDSTIEAGWQIYRASWEESNGILEAKTTGSLDDRTAVIARRCAIDYSSVETITLRTTFRVTSFLGYEPLPWLEFGSSQIVISSGFYVIISVDRAQNYRFRLKDQDHSTTEPLSTFLADGDIVQIRFDNRQETEFDLEYDVTASINSVEVWTDTFSAPKQDLWCNYYHGLSGGWSFGIIPENGLIGFDDYSLITS